MRKIVAALLVVFILGSSIPSGLAQDYHRQVLEYLAGQLQVGEEDIHLEGNLMELPLSGEQLWAGRYFLKEEGGEAGSDPAAGEGEVPGSAGNYDTGDASDPDGSVSSGPLMGTIFLRVKTGEILTAEESALFWEEERKLEQQELERLGEEAGIISPYLYRQLINAPPDQKFIVTIWLKYVETAAMREAMEEVYREYPEFPGGEVPPSYGRTEPADAGAGDSGGSAEPYPPPADGAAGEIEPGYAGDSAEFSILPYPDEKKEAEESPVEDPAVPPEGMPPDMIDRDSVDWSRYEEMQNRLAEIRLQGYQESMARLAGDLAAMNVSYEILGGGAAVSCELTAEQALSLKDKEYIDSIGEEIGIAEDGREPALARDLMWETDDGALEKTGRPVYWAFAAALLLLACAGGYAIVYKKRKALKEQ